MVATTLILVLLAPMFVTIGLVLKLSRPGAVFFRQTRIGRNGAFGMLRFGSWRHSPGLLSIDRTLEESGLAALPTLINVLRGELSLIGPPPHPADDRGLSTIDGRSALGFRPGLFSWQLLVAAGAVQMTIDEAKLRDAERGVGNDLKLMWYSARGALYRR
jgi:lipopolysaccharide/colanic/teichoic acid biosynthesis glycosyltransferase